MNKNSTQRSSDRSVRLITASLAGAACAVSLAGLAEAQINFDWPVYFNTHTGSGAVTADLNHDGRPEIVRWDEDHVGIYTYDVIGGLTEINTLPGYNGNDGTVPRVGDIDGDGNVDVAWVEEYNRQFLLNVFYNDGTGTDGQIVQLNVASRLWTFRLSDIDSDHDLDIIATDADHGITVLHNDGRARFVSDQVWTDGPSRYGWDLQIGDFDGDGDTDIVGAFTEDSYWFYLYQCEFPVLINDGTGKFSTETIYHPQARMRYDEPLKIALGDMDGDGDLDIVLSATRWRDFDSYYTDIYIIVNHGDHSAISMLGPVEGGIMSLDWDYGYDLRLMDIDLDGDLDVVTVSAGEQAVFVSENIGGYRLAPWIAFPTGNLFNNHLAECDLEGDGLQDLLVDGFGMNYLQNITPFNGPLLQWPTLHRGEDTNFVMTNAQPEDRAYFLYSLSGIGNSVGISQLGGITLDLAGHIMIAGQAQADANGTAMLSVRVPDQAPLLTIGLQAVIRRGVGGSASVKTPPVSAEILP